MDDVVLDSNFKKIFYYWGWVSGLLNPLFWVIYIILSNPYVGQPHEIQGEYRILNRRHEKFVYVWGTSIGLIYFILLPFYILLVLV